MKIQPRWALQLALYLVCALLTLSAPSQATGGEAATEEQLRPLGRLAIQQGGRVKPLDTYARETVREITGKERFQGHHPLWTVLLWLSHPEDVLDQPLVEIRNLELKKKLGLPESERWHAYRKITAAPGIEELRSRLREKNQGGEKLTREEQEEQDLFVKLHLLQGLLSGESLTMVPDAHDPNHAWGALSGHRPPKVSAEEGARLQKPLKALLVAAREGRGDQVQAASVEIGQVLQSLGPVPGAEELEREVLYNSLHPFRKAWFLYLAGLILLACAGLGQRPQGGLVGRLGVLGIFLGFGMHTYGFYLRCLIAGRPPVTNMYESVIWVTWGAILFALILEAFTRGRSFLLASASMAVLGLVMADNLPAVLNPTIQPLTPVLRSNFWLTIHVLTITLGYAAFLLGLGLAHMALWQYLKGSEDRARLKDLHVALYRSLQIGVLLLAAGTILGGVWANYSWGRFWGWDPKEVWALIALLGYLVLLHGRYAGWMGNFGLAAGSVLAFMMVMMAWYGVNFILGAGLHSYGFGTGGYSYVATYVVAELLFVALVAWRHHARSAAR